MSNLLKDIPTFKPLVLGKQPKMIGSVVDLYYETRQQRLEVDKLSAALKAQESMLKGVIIDTVPKSNSTGAAGKLANALIVMKTTPAAKDWDLIYKYIQKNKAFELLQRRLSTEAVVERWDAGQEIPGVEHMHFKDLSLNKL